MASGVERNSFFFGGLISSGWDKTRDGDETRGLVEIAVADVNDL